MTTSVRMLGWSAQGLRCPDYKISFEDENGGNYPVNLIQMPNGTGKTTTLALLRAALSGSADTEKWSADIVNSFRKKNGGENTGEFQVLLKYNDNRVTITMHFDFAEGTVEYFTTIGNGKANGFHPPKECKDFFNPDFINFFVFDGELAQQLLDPKFANAERAIEYLYKLKYFGEMNGVIEDYWQRIVDSSSASDMKGLNRRRNRVASLIVRIEFLKNDKNKIQVEFNSLNKKLIELRSKYEENIKAMDDFGSDYEEKKKALQTAETSVNSNTQVLLKDIRSPHFLSFVFGNDILTLKKNMDKVKLPESTAKEFFQELAEEDRCVCGRILDEEHRNFIREQSTKYLGSEEMSLLNNIKLEIAEQINDDPNQNVIAFKSKLNLYRNNIQERGRAKTELNILEDTITNGNSELLDAKFKIEEIQNKVITLQYDLNKFDDKDKDVSDEKSFGIDLLEQRLKDAKQKLAEITETVEIKQKTETILSILKRALNISQKEIAENIKDKTNERIKTLLPNNDIRISKIDRALKLEGQDAGSVGETLSVAYAFMATLFSGADRQLPFIVDSPANAIDLKVRTEVAQIIPKLSDQFIAFTISSERGSFIGPLEKACNGNVQYITMFRKGDKLLEASAKEYKNTVYSDDGIFVPGREFFWNFHMESEGDE